MNQKDMERYNLDHHAFPDLVHDLPEKTISRLMVAPEAAICDIYNTLGRGKLDRPFLSSEFNCHVVTAGEFTCIYIELPENHGGATLNSTHIAVVFRKAGDRYYLPRTFNIDYAGNNPQCKYITAISPFSNVNDGYRVCADAGASDIANIGTIWELAFGCRLKTSGIAGFLTLAKAS